MNRAPREALIGIGVFFTSAALLLLEITLTRILSVVMWYHFAFFTISVALFGLSASALLVFLKPGWFRSERTLGASFFALAALTALVPLSFVLLATNPAQLLLTSFTTSSGVGVGDVLGLVALYLTSVVPFFLGGLVMALVFRDFGRSASTLYSFDLVGAALGCVAAVPILNTVNGPTAMVASSVLAATGALVFGLAARDPRRATIAALLAAGAIGLMAANPSTGWLHLRYYRGRTQPDVVYERWNSFSRIAVRDTGTPDSLLIEIDSASNTMASQWDGRGESLAPLKDDLIAVPYALLDRPSVFVIGSGGGIDLLTAVAWGARRVQAVEVNPIIVDLMMNKYREFSGGIYRRPEIAVAMDEARSFIRRSDERYDLIQAGYVDTYAATAAGAFSLTENTLYTRQAYRDYLAHLSPDGIVAMQRYYEDPPQQAIRLVSLALAALHQRGDAAPSRHVAVVREADRASVLVKNSPFSDAEVARLAAHCDRSGLELIAAPGRFGDTPYGRLLAAPDFRAAIAAYPLDISPTSDDRPFFFYVVKPTQFWRGLLLQSGERVNSRAVFLLTSLLLISAALCVLLILAPALALRARIGPGAAPAMSFFGMLGLGFMLVEIGLLQRVMLFLGHPGLALSVVLSTLLVSAGLGAGWTRRFAVERSGPALRALLVAVLAMIVIIAFAWPPIFEAFVGLERPARIALSVAALFPAGLLMGTAFPIGLRRLATARPVLIPWAWSVNGATSVLGSVLAMVVAINNGFTVTLLLGAACYAAAIVLAPATARGTAAD